MPKKKRRWIYRSAITGKFVSFLEWIRHPRTTVREEVKEDK